jgi:uncharacterized Zn-binding protein involved in type VI secretion
MAGKPAARMGDTAMNCADPVDTPTGTVIAVGTVLINKMPAAKQNDQIVGLDVHIIMIPSPAGPIPTPLPHPFVGMINGETESTVKIMGQPAAVVGSTAQAQPPHIPQGGPFQKPPANKSKIMMGSPNVLIGGGGGSGSGSGGTGEKAVKATSKAGEALKGHKLDVKFVDKGGKPVMGLKYDVKDPEGVKSSGALTGEVKREGVAEGSHEIALKGITQAKWSKDNATVDDKVKMIVKTVGIKSGTPAVLEIYIKDTGFADRMLRSFETKVKSDKIEEEWALEVDAKFINLQAHDAEEQGGYSGPLFYFRVVTDGIMSRSGILRITDYIEVELTDEDGNGVEGAEYKFKFPNGSVRKGKLDGSGKAKEEKIPPGKAIVSIDVKKSKK